jgi:hypothetical protein
MVERKYYHFIVDGVTVTSLSKCSALIKLSKEMIKREISKAIKKGENNFMDYETIVYFDEKHLIEKTSENVMTKELRDHLCEKPTKKFFYKGLFLEHSHKGKLMKTFSTGVFKKQFPKIYKMELIKRYRQRLSKPKGVPITTPCMFDGSDRMIDRYAIEQRRILSKI